MQENPEAPSNLYDIVVTGIAGSGKTTLINRIRGSTTEGDHDIQHVGKLKSTPCSLGGYLFGKLQIFVTHLKMVLRTALGQV